MLIREAEITDLEIILEMGRGCSRFEPVEGIRFWQEDEVRDLMASEQDKVYVAQGDEGLVGFAIFTYNPPTRKVTSENTWVDSNSRGNNIFGGFFEEALRYYQSIGARYMCALVARDNSSPQRALGKAGFKRGELAYWYLRSISGP
jgi:hypothetical protein